MIRPSISSYAALCGAVVALGLAGCKKPQIRVYTVAHQQPVAPATPVPESSETAAAPSDTASAPAVHRRPSHLDYKLPEGWKDMGPSQFSLVNFRIETPKGNASVTVTPLGGLTGQATTIINMWRTQVGEEPLDEAAAKASLSTVDIGGQKGQLFEVTGKPDGRSQRIVTAFVENQDGSIFYKLQGSDEAVTEQKATFLDFLKTVKVQEGPAPETAATEKPTPPPEPPAPSVNMVAPEGWRAETPGQMQVAKFSVAKDDGKADVSVSVFASDTGGTLGNVNRWRTQMGLPTTDDAGLAECVTPLGAASVDGAPGPILVDLSNNNRRLLGAIVPREGQWWFYKMIGDAPVVNAQHDAFVQFAKSQP